VAAPRSEPGTPRQPDTLPTPHSHPPGVRLPPLEGNTVKDSTRKERSHGRKDGETARRQVGQKDGSRAHVPADRLTDLPTFVIPEVGLTNRQVWATTLGELARRGAV